MSGLWKDLPYKISKKVKENWLDTLFFLVPTIGTYQCAPVARSWQSRRQPATCARSGEGGARLAANPSVLTSRCALTLSWRARYALSYKEKEKLHHRY